MKVIFFTGAGISEEAGIPTFQNQDGIRAKLRRSYARKNPGSYRDTIRMMMDACEAAAPTPAHQVIAAAQYPVITMNVDQLHRIAGTKNLVEVHGILPTRAELMASDFPTTYKGIVLYDDEAPLYATAYKMVGELTSDDFFIIVGTSFYTEVSIELLRIAQSHHVRGVVINDNASKKVPKVCELLTRMREATEAGATKDEINEIYQEILTLGQTLTEARKANDPYYLGGIYYLG